MGSINDVKIVNKFKPLYIGEQKCLSYRKGKLYSHSLITDNPVYFGRLPMTKKQRFLSQNRLTERMFVAPVCIPGNEKDGKQEQASCDDQFSPW